MPEEAADETIQDLPAERERSEAERETSEEVAGGPVGGGATDASHEADPAADGPSSDTPKDVELHQRPDLSPVGAMPSAAEWSNLMSMAKVISASGLAPKVNNRPMTPEAVAVTALKGRELGIPPMQALSHIHVIEGRPTASAELMRSMVLREGHFIAVREQTKDAACVIGKRKEWAESMPPVEVWYLREEAEEAGLAHKSNWKKHPVDMLVARATSRMCRQIFADVLMGASYTPDELDAEVDYTVEGEITVTVERDQQQAAAPVRRREDDGTPITDGQKTKLSVLLKELGIRQDGQGGDVLYRAGMMAAYGVDSIKGLSKLQATNLIDVFERGKQTTDKETGEVKLVAPEEMAAAFLSRGSAWLAEQERSESDGGQGPRLDENGEPIVDAEVVDDE